MKTETYTCDICGNGSTKDREEKQLQVIFLTNQTDGAYSTPHLSSERVNYCKECEDRILNGEYVYGKGAQGYNTFHFKRINQ